MFSFSVGLELGQILIVLLILLLIQLVVGVLKIKRRYWVLFVLIAVFGLALRMAVERWPGQPPQAPQPTPALPVGGRPKHRPLLR